MQFSGTEPSLNIPFLKAKDVTVVLLNWTPRRGATTLLAAPNLHFVCPFVGCDSA